MDKYKSGSGTINFLQSRIKLAPYFSRGKWSDDPYLYPQLRIISRLSVAFRTNQSRALHESNDPIRHKSPSPHTTFYGNDCRGATWTGVVFPSYYTDDYYYCPKRYPENANGIPRP